MKGASRTEAASYYHAGSDLHCALLMICIGNLAQDPGTDFLSTVRDALSRILLWSPRNFRGCQNAWVCSDLTYATGSSRGSQPRIPFNWFERTLTSGSAGVASARWGERVCGVDPADARRHARSHGFGRAPCRPSGAQPVLWNIPAHSILPSRGSSLLDCL